jgi:hypothetical protein
MKILVTVLGAFEIDSDNFEKNITSIYVTYGFGSRFFGNFNTNAGPLCSKIGNENKREFGAMGNWQLQDEYFRWSSIEQRIRVTA